jgi:murein DD-endopeptidase MepM/ murein hydrolase activator NlpD
VRLAAIGAFLALCAPAAALGATGGAGIAPAPEVRDVHCVATRNMPCIDDQWVKRGGRIEIRGRYLRTATAVVFYGRKRPADDITAPVRARRASTLVARVPAKARSGPLAVISTGGLRSTRWSGLVIDEPPAAIPVPKQTGSRPSIGTSMSAPRKVFYGGRQKAVFVFQVGGSQAVDVTVNLVRLVDGVAVRNWLQPQVQPGIPQKIVWDGTAGGKVQPEGYYSFQLVGGAATGAQAALGAPEQNSFAFYGHMFPIRGAHDYGGAAGRYGAKRTGHIHQGQDVMARCGTRLVAARAGTVVYSGYHSLAGYYLVVHGRGSGLDYVYMHLRRPALVREGDRVYTGQRIGEVGQTGDATACHLHFELWSAPGWYKGGSSFDPLPELKRWDSVS